MIIILHGIFLVTIFFGLMTFTFFSTITRFSFSQEFAYNGLNKIINSKASQPLMLLLFVYFIVINIIGNIPTAIVPTLIYAYTTTFSVLFWVALISCVSVTSLKEFLAHILPYGSPLGLILFLPLVEIFSQLIRPITLIIRLSTNLSAGHIILYIFSYFALLSAHLAPSIFLVIYILMILELCISILQAYIFVTLICLYINETLYFYSIINILVCRARDLGLTSKNNLLLFI